MRGQVDDLTEIPPVNPAIPKTPDTWKCFIVTNGTIAGPTLRTISDVSDAKKRNGKMPVETIVKEELLKRFNDGFGEYFPAEPKDISIFFKMYCEPGDSVINKEEFKVFFENFFYSIDGKSKQKKIEAIQSSLILCSYLLANKYKEENYVAIIDGWVLVLATILHFAHKWKIEQKSYALSEEIVQEELDQVYARLIEDVVEDEKFLVDTTYGLLSEPFITHKLRCTELMGYIYAGFCYSKLGDRTKPEALDGAEEKFLLIQSNKIIVSEGMLPLYYSSILFYLLQEKTDFAVTQLKDLTNLVLIGHDEGNRGLPNPYYSIEQAVSYSLGVNEEDVNEDFLGRSYCLWPAILLLAKCSERDWLNEVWPKLALISSAEVVAKDTNDLLLWRVKDCELIDTFPNPQQSWKDLLSEASESYDGSIPQILLTRKHLIPFFLVVMPHRFSSKLLLSLLNQA